MAGFPEPQDGVVYLTEGGQETELSYKHGHELPEFAMYPLLDDPAAVADLRAMYERYLDVAAAHDLVPLMGGLDYRASPDWAGKLGISPERLVELQLRSVEFLREVARPYDLPRVLVAGIVGPRGDAYGLEHTMSAEEAEDYHGVQLETLRRADVDLVSAMTFTSVDEAVGLARAAAAVGLPLCVSFLVGPSGDLLGGGSLGEAITAVDERTGPARPDFYGLNCAHPVEMQPALLDGPWLERIRSLRPNAVLADKQALCQIGHLESGDPELLGKQVAGLVSRLPSVDVVGGCCGTWDDHLAAIARELRPSGAA